MEGLMPILLRTLSLWWWRRFEHQSLAILGLQDQCFEVKSRALLEPLLHSGFPGLAAVVVREPIAGSVGKPTALLH